MTAWRRHDIRSAAAAAAAVHDKTAGPAEEESEEREVARSEGSTELGVSAPFALDAATNGTHSRACNRPGEFSRFCSGDSPPALASRTALCGAVSGSGMIGSAGVSLRLTADGHDGSLRVGCKCERELRPSAPALVHGEHVLCLRSRRPSRFGHGRLAGEEVGRTSEKRTLTRQQRQKRTQQSPPQQQSQQSQH